MAKKLALDAGALIALFRGDQRTRAVLERWTREGVPTIVPAPVLTETIRGGPADAPVQRILNSRPFAVAIVPVFESAARDAGVRLGRLGRSELAMDALIVASAIDHGASDILTSDPGDLTALAHGEITVLPLDS